MFVSVHLWSAASIEDAATKLTLAQGAGILRLRSLIRSPS